MLDTAWQGQIASLKGQLENEISERENTAEWTVPSYICINNLKSKLKRLNEISEILNIDKYRLIFIGTIGEGKTTAICHLFDLTGQFRVTKNIAGKSNTVEEVQELLATGSGRTTICEVVIEASRNTFIEVEPYTREQMENLIIDFCESLADTENMQGEPKTMISKEIETAIRNVTNFNRVSRTVSAEGDKKQTIRVDKAKEEFERSGIDGLREMALRNANLENRLTTKIECPSDTEERLWIKRTFAQINSGELEQVAIPKKIRICLSENLLSSTALLQFQSVVDTKGIDENPIRKDLQEYIEKQDSICLFATNFKDAPETNVRELMKYYLSSKSRDFHHRFITFVVTHKGEPEKVNGGDGSWELGTEIRREDIQSAFKNLNLEFFPENIIFYDALRYYSTHISQLDPLYTVEDVQSERENCFQAIHAVIERRNEILRVEVAAIEASFQRIKEGETLTGDEVKAIEDAIQNIKSLRELSRRVPSFVYEEYINSFVSYYHDNYRAWNTKHAIHRRFGIYDARQISLFYDAKIVAEGSSEDEMLRKFTKEAKEELEEILYELTNANEALETFIPELIRQLDTYYDDFIMQVGESVEEFLQDEKLTPRSIISDFWTALINEKGKHRAKGETYTDNVCQTLRRELESDSNLNLFLQIKAEENWASLIRKVLQFFGEK